MKFTPYSFSKVNTYIQCPKKFEFNYINKINLFVPNLATERGSYIHTLLENKTKNKETVFKFNAITPEIEKECYAIYEDYINSPKGLQYFSGKVEAELTFGVKASIDGFQVCSYYDKECLFRGKIDHVILHDDFVELLDFKTGKVSAFPAPLQLVMYSVWAFLKYPEIDLVRTAFLYIEHGNQEKEYIFYREHFDKLLKKVVEKLVSVEKAKSFPKTESPLCNFCSYRKEGMCLETTPEEFQDKISDMIKPYKRKSKKELFYYIHPESGRAWIQDYYEEYTDGLTEEVSADIFYSLEDLGYDKDSIDYTIQQG